MQKYLTHCTTVVLATVVEKYHCMQHVVLIQWTPQLSWQPWIGVQYALNNISFVLSEADENVRIALAYKALHIICHLASNPLPHYLAKFEYSTVQLYIRFIQFKSVQYRLFTVIIKMSCSASSYMQINLQYYIVCKNVRHQYARVLWVESPLVNGCIDDVLFSVVPNV